MKPSTSFGRVAFEWQTLSRTGACDQAICCGMGRAERLLHGEKVYGSVPQEVPLRHLRSAIRSACLAAPASARSLAPGAGPQDDRRHIQQRCWPLHERIAPTPWPQGLAGDSFATDVSPIRGTHRPRLIVETASGSSDRAMISVGATIRPRKRGSSASGPRWTKCLRSRSLLCQRRPRRHRPVERRARGSYRYAGNCSSPVGSICCT